MNPGLLRHFVHLQRPTVVQSDEGESIETWITVRTIWIELLALTGSEFFAAQAVQATVQYRARCRAADVEDAATSWRIKTEDGRVLGITAKLVDDRDRSMSWLLLGELVTEEAT